MSTEVFDIPEDQINVDVVEEPKPAPAKKKPRKPLNDTQKAVLKERLKKAREAKLAKAKAKKDVGEPAAEPKKQVFESPVKVEEGKSSNEYNEDIKMLRDELKNLRKENERMRHKMEMDELKNQIKELQGLMKNAKKEEKAEEKKPELKVKEDQKVDKPVEAPKPEPTRPPPPPQPRQFSMLNMGLF